jgi:hypothetical protein
MPLRSEPLGLYFTNPDRDNMIYAKIEQQKLEDGHHLVRSFGYGPHPARLVMDGMRALDSVGYTPPPMMRSWLRMALIQDRKIPAIKELRLATSLGLKEAKDVVDAVAAAYREAVGFHGNIVSPLLSTPERSRPSPEEGREPDTEALRQPGALGPAWSWPRPDSHHDLVTEFVRLLKMERRRAGEPSYKTLCSATGYSRSTLVRAFSDQSLPGWGLVEVILKAFGVSVEEIETTWRRRWLIVQETLDPVGLYSTDDPFGEKTTTPTETGTAERVEPLSVITDIASRTRAALRDIDDVPTQAIVPDAARFVLCHRCGALVGDQQLHLEWHQAIENPHISYTTNNY